MLTFSYLLGKLFCVYHNNKITLRLTEHIQNCYERCSPARRRDDQTSPPAPAHRRSSRGCWLHCRGYSRAHTAIDGKDSTELMQFNSNSDFPGSNFPVDQWINVASPPTPFEPAEFIPCACLTTRVLIRVDNTLAGLGANTNEGGLIDDSHHVVVGGINYIVKTAKGVVVRTPSTIPEGDGGLWSDSSDESSSSDNGDVNMVANGVAATGRGGWQSQTTPSHAPPQSTNHPMQHQQHQTSQVTERSYWLRRTLRTAIYGQVKYGIVLHKLNPPIRVMLPTTRHSIGGMTQSTEVVSVDWEASDEAVAVKEMSWEHIRSQKDRLAEDPIKVRF